MSWLQALNEIRHHNESYPDSPFIREATARGQKVIGWLCNYVPEELVHAAGMLPVRVRGGLGEMPVEDANAVLYTTTCTAMKSCLQLALGKSYDFLAGFIHSFVCDAARNLAEAWQPCVGTPFAYTFYVPRLNNEKGLAFYRETLLELKEKLEKLAGRPIESADLNRAIKLSNRTRALLHRFYELRKEDPPALSGAEAMELTNAAQTMPREQFQALAEEVLAGLNSKERGQPKPRLMLTGSMLNNPKFVGFVEEQGFFVVIDELCTGYRYFADMVEEDSPDPLGALARRYLGNFPCPQMYPVETRMERIMGLAREYRVQGVVMEVIRYCTPYGWQRPLLKKSFEEANIPFLALDVEYGAEGSGQLKTRLQAFLEMVKTSLATV